MGHAVEHHAGEWSAAALGVGMDERRGDMEIGSVAEDEDVLVEGEGKGERGEGSAGLEERREGVGIWKGAL